MKTSSKGKSEMLGGMQWSKSKMLVRHLANEMLGRMQWELAKVSQKC